MANILPITYSPLPTPHTMKLNQKTVLILGLTLTGLIGVLYATVSTIFMKQVHELEVGYTEKAVARTLEVLSEDINSLTVAVRQLAAWDDTYNFMKDRNNRFLETNFSNETFSDLKLNQVIFTDASDQIIFGKGFDFKNGKIMPISKALKQHIAPSKLLLQHTYPKSNYQGIIILPESPLMVVSHPVVNNRFQRPIRGTLVMGRYLDDDEIKRLANITLLSIAIYPLNNYQLPPELEEARSALIKQQPNNKKNHHQSPVYTFKYSRPNPDQTLVYSSTYVQHLNENRNAGYTIIKDIYGQPALILQVNMRRAVYNQGKMSLNYLLWSLIAISLAFGVANLLLLQKLVLSRLARLSEGVKTIGETSNFSIRLSIPGKDELSSLGDTINWMLETLERSLKEVKWEKQKAENLLLNILPESIAIRLKKEPSTIADNFAEATVLFADIVGFTKMSAQTSPVELVKLLNQIFSAFDRLVEQHGLEKIKTIGDAYMVVGGLPIPRLDHAEAVAAMALDMLLEIKKFNAENNVNFNMRIGINTGPVVAGVIGIKKFIYDLWGDTVNTASRMESHGLPGCIQVTAATYHCLKDKFTFEERGLINIKGKGEMMTYLLLARKADSSNLEVLG